MLNRRTLSEVKDLLLNTCTPHHLSAHFWPCGDEECPNEFIDFELKDYVNFINNAETLVALKFGLSELSPFADDALDVAELMTEADFIDFRLALVHERGSRGTSLMPERFTRILVPDLFIEASPLAEEFGASLSITMLRILEETATDQK